MIYKYCSNCNCKYPVGSVCKCGGSKRARYKRYKDNRKDKDTQLFYRSIPWINKRGEIKDRDKGLCLYCYFIRKEIEFANLVHHIKEIKEDWERRLDDDNLICLCSYCHSKVHSIYKESEYNKLKLQDMLTKLIKLSEEKLNSNVGKEFQNIPPLNFSEAEG